MTEAEPVFTGVPKSAMAGVVWPAVPGRQTAAHFALLYQLEQTQWWAPERIRAWQFRQIQTLLSHAARHVPFYRERLRQAGIHPDRPIAPEVFAAIPVMTRADIQEAGARLHARHLPNGHGPTHKVSSSGSTGRPIETMATRVSGAMWDVFTMRDHLWHRRDLSGTLASIRGFATGKALYPQGARLPNWGATVGSLYPTGPAVALSIMTRPEEQAEWLVRHNPDYLLTFPTALRALARHCADRGIAPPRLKQARTLSEILTPDTRAAVRAAWGVDVADMYSARETGYLALQCPNHEHYHVQAEGVHLEILDDTGAPCPPGRMGRVVVTPLHNFAMPLIRYEIGDYAEAGPPCPCGRGLPVLARIAGRVRNMLRLPDGGHAWPLVGEPFFARIPVVRQFQIVQRALERLDMTLVADRPLSGEEEARLRAMITDRLGYPFEIALNYVDEIPRGPGGKFEDFRCEIPEP